MVSHHLAEWGVDIAWGIILVPGTIYGTWVTGRGAVRWLRRRFA